MTATTTGISDRVIAAAACRPHPRNYNRHSDAQTAALADSLQRFGQVRAIVVQERDDGLYWLVAGHGVWEAARRLGLGQLRASVIPADWPEERVLAYLVADNELARQSDPDAEQLAAILRDVAEYDQQLAAAAVGGGEVSNDDRADWTEAWALFPGDVVYCWHAGVKAAEVQHSLEAAGFEMRAQIIWSKPHFPISRGHYHWRHEPCWYAVRQGGQAHWIGDRAQTTVWEITLDENVAGGHGTQKPVECMAKGLRNHEGDVYDPFVGSGTTLEAAERLGRLAYVMDIAPKYVAVTLERAKRMGLEPERTE